MTGTTNGATHPPAVNRVLVLGYYDGATDGVLELGGLVYRFDLADDAHNPGGVDARSYTLRLLPADALDRLAAVLVPHHQPTWPVWCPVWRFPTPALQRQMEMAVDAILEQCGPPVGELSTTDPYTFGAVRVSWPATVAGS